MGTENKRGGIGGLRLHGLEFGRLFDLNESDFEGCISCNLVNPWKGRNEKGKVDGKRKLLGFEMEEDW